MSLSETRATQVPASDDVIASLTARVPAVVFRVRADGHVLQSDDAGRDAMKSRTPTSVGKSIFDLYADAPQLIAVFRRALAGESFSDRFEVTVDGRTVVYEAAFTPAYHADGSLDYTAGLVLDITRRETAVREALQLTEQLRRLAARLQSEREAERTRIARMVHDSVGQVLTALRFDARWLRRQIDGERQIDRKAVLGRLDELDGMVDEAIGVVQNLALDLRPPILDELGLSAATKATAQRFAHRTGLDVRLDAPLDAIIEARLDLPRATAAFRIVQEALTNVARHASARNVRIRLWTVETTADTNGRLNASADEQGDSRSGPALVVEVDDDGVGIAPKTARAGSPGLTGMSERAAEWGGTLFVGCNPEGGARVRAVLPLDGLQLPAQ